MRGLEEDELFFAEEYKGVIVEHNDVVDDDDDNVWVDDVCEEAL